MLTNFMKIYPCLIALICKDVLDPLFASGGLFRSLISFLVNWLTYKLVTPPFFIKEMDDCVGRSQAKIRGRMKSDRLKKCPCRSKLH